MGVRAGQAACLLIVMSTFFMSILAVSQPQKWDYLAPFPAGVRELGADPLVRFGGIFRIPRADSTTYPSELVFGARVGWGVAHTNTTTNQVTLPTWNDTYVNWNLMEAWAGSAVDTFQGWAVGDFEVATSEAGNQRVMCVGVEWYYIDGPELAFVGDQYGANLAFQSVYLTAGKHTLYVALPSTTAWSCSFAPASRLFLTGESVLPDIVNGFIASPYASVTLLNGDAQQWLMLTEIDIVTPNVNLEFVVTGQAIAPAQITPFPFMLQQTGPLPCNATSQALVIDIVLIADDVKAAAQLTFNCRAWGDWYTFTFLDQDGSIQLAAATPPVHPCPLKGCPVLLTLHGAGVVANGPAWTTAYVRQNYTWTLFPTNRRPYGFDWQGAGFANIWSTLYYLSTQLPGVPESLRTQFSVNQYKLLYAGLSQWRPLPAGSATPCVSSLPRESTPKASLTRADIPFFLRLERAHISPYVQSLLDHSSAEWNADAYMEHLKEVPLLVRFGSQDDNVPPYHLRRMARLHDEFEGKPQSTVVSEVPGEGHWFNGVVDDAFMQAWFDAHATNQLPALPQSFTVHSYHPVSSEGRGGVSIRQFLTPYREARVRVVPSASGEWKLTTDNVRRLGFNKRDEIPSPEHGFSIDGASFSSVGFLPLYEYCQFNAGEWNQCTTDSTERIPDTYGPLVQILYNGAPLAIVYGTKVRVCDGPTIASVEKKRKGTSVEVQARRNVAVALSNVLYYQGNFAVQVVEDVDARVAVMEAMNVIVLGGPASNWFYPNVTRSPVQFSPSGAFTIGPHEFAANSGYAVMYLAPWSDYGGLAAVIEGQSTETLLRTLTAFPKKSGMQVPDWIVLGPDWGYSGIAGATALGFWDNFWRFDSANSFVDTLQL